MSNIVCCIVLVYPVVFPTKNENSVLQLFYNNCINSGCFDGIKFVDIDTSNNIKCSF